MVSGNAFPDAAVKLTHGSFNRVLGASEVGEALGGLVHSRPLMLPEAPCALLSSLRIPTDRCNAR